MATPDGDERVLPEQSIADLGGVVPSASSALVPLAHRVGNPRDGTGAGIDDLLAAPVSNHLFLHHDSLAVGGNSHGKLHILKLPRALTGVLAARRQIHRSFLKG